MKLCAMNPDFDHIRDKMLRGHEMRTMETITTQLHVVVVKDKSLGIY